MTPCDPKEPMLGMFAFWVQVFDAGLYMNSVLSMYPRDR